MSCLFTYPVLCEIIMQKQKTIMRVQCVNVGVGLQCKMIIYKFNNEWNAYGSMYTQLTSNALAKCVWKPG